MVEAHNLEESRIQWYFKHAENETRQPKIVVLRHHADIFRFVQTRNDFENELLAS